MMNKTNMFKQKDLGNGVIRIESTGSVFAYLVKGKKKAALIDTLTGLGNIREYVETICTLPVTVLITHVHLDHAGGVFDFDEAWLPERDLSLMPKAADAEKRFAYEKMTAEEAGMDFEYTIEDFAVPGKTAYRFLHDREVFDLGGRSLTAISVPGHTAGSMGFLDSETGIFFSGDCGNNRTFLFLPESVTVSEYLDSLLALKKNYGGKIRRWFISHVYTEMPPEILDELIECCRLIISGKENGQKFQFGLAGYESMQAVFCNAVDSEEKRLDGKWANIVFDPERRQLCRTLEECG